MRGANHAIAAAALAAALGAGCASAADHRVPPAPAPLREPAAAGDPGAAIPSGPLTVDGAVRLALARNPDLGSARARIEAALAGLEAARSGYWPRLSAEASYVRSDAPSVFLFRTIDAHALEPGTDFNSPGTFDNLEIAGGLRWNLWDGGRTTLAEGAAAASEAAAREGLSAVRNALVAGVVSAFLDVRAAAEVLAADEASIRSLEAGVEETRVRVEGGAALRSDLLSLEVRLAEARQGRLRSDLARRLALANLRRLLALPVDAPLDLADGPFTGGGGIPGDLSTALLDAWSRRAETAALRREAERARMEVDAARRAWLPRLDAEARTWADDGDATGGFGNGNWMVGLALSLDLFDGGARGAALHRAEAALAEIEERDRALLHGIALEVETAWLRLDEARARHGVTRRSVEAAEESYDLVEKQYRGGSATVTRYLEAEAARTRVRTTEVGARLDVERAAVELARALGMLAGTGAAGEGGAR